MLKVERIEPVEMATVFDESNSIHQSCLHFKKYQFLLIHTKDRFQKNYLLSQLDSFSLMSLLCLD